MQNSQTVGERTRFRPDSPGHGAMIRPPDAADRLAWAQSLAHPHRTAPIH